MAGTIGYVSALCLTFDPRTCLYHGGQGLLRPANPPGEGFLWDINGCPCSAGQLSTGPPGPGLANATTFRMLPSNGSTLVLPAQGKAMDGREED
jgi:hypothetical protein